MATPLAVAAGLWAAAFVSVEAFHHLRRASLRRLLRDLAPALDGAGLTWWADFGGLLGIHRDGDLVIFDNDVDLVALNPDWPALMAALRARLPPRYSLKLVMPQGKPGSSWVRVYCPLGMADIFGAYTDEGDADTIFVDNGHDDTMHIDRALVLPPGRKEWRGCQLSVPADVEGTLGRRYGDWRTPKHLAKGADTVEASKPYMKVLRALARIGIRV